MILHTPHLTITLWPMHFSSEQIKIMLPMLAQQNWKGCYSNQTDCINSIAMRVLRFQLSMLLTGRLAPCFGLEKIFQMAAWRVMAHAVTDSFRGRCVLGFTLAQPISINKVSLNPTEQDIILHRTAFCRAR
ncbi:hypothetical protein C1S86_22965, partial [Vibrio parahaemolyticus]|uniref:hypothetical protein n=1 Tax=Vibrio parahaemolyticus TaxID=670 RepID=UPI00099395EE